MAHVREFRSGHRVSKKYQRSNRKRRRNLPSLNKSHSQQSILQQQMHNSRNNSNHSNSLGSRNNSSTLLLDPLVGPLMMAKADEAEYLLSRNPSKAMLSPYTPYTTSKNTNHRNHRNKLRKHKCNRQHLIPLKHSKSAPPSKKGIARLKTLHGGGDGKVTVSHDELDSNQINGGGAEFRVVQNILKREHALRELQRMVSSSNTRPYFATDVIYLLLDLRKMAVDVIESINNWRKPHSKIFDFQWEGQNYLVKMFQDSSFLKVCRPLGLIFSLPGLANNPLLEFDDASINKAMNKYQLPKNFVNALKTDKSKTIDYDPIDLEKEKKQPNILSTKLKLPVMYAHAKHIIEDELKRLSLTHDIINSKLIPTKEYLQYIKDMQVLRKRERMTLKREQFEVLKKRQNVRDRKGFETEEDEKQSMSIEEWKIKKLKETKEDLAVINRNKPKEDENSYSYRRNLLLKPKTRDELIQLENDLKQLLSMLHRCEQDETNLQNKIIRLELSLRSISQEGLLPTMMTTIGKMETKQTVDKFTNEIYRGGHLVQQSDIVNSNNNDNETNSSSKKKEEKENVLNKLLEESNMQDFVGGWRLTKLKLEYTSCHERVELLRNELKVRKQDVQRQKQIMNSVELAKNASKKKKDKERQKLLEARAQRLAKGLKNMGVRSSTTKKKRNKEKMGDRRNVIVEGSKSIRDYEEEKENSHHQHVESMQSESTDMNQEMMKDEKDGHNSLNENMKATMKKLSFIRSNGVYPHSAMLIAPRRRAKGQISGALPVLQHGGVYGTGVVNRGVFLSRKVVYQPPFKKKRSIVAERNSSIQEEKSVLIMEDQEQSNGLRTSIMNGGGIIIPINPSVAQLHELRKASIHQNNTRKILLSTCIASEAKTSPLNKYKPYLDTKLNEEDIKWKKKRMKLKRDWFTYMIEHPSIYIDNQDNQLNRSIFTPAESISHSATSLPSSATSGLFSTPSGISGMNYVPSKNIPVTNTNNGKMSFATSARSPLIIIIDMLSIKNVVMIEALLSKKITLIYTHSIQSHLPLMTIEIRKMNWIKPILAERADSAREALAFYRASLRTLQSLNPSDGDALFLAHASRDVAARRVVDALQLLSIHFGSMTSATTTTSSSSSSISRKKDNMRHNSKKRKNNGHSGKQIKMGWDTVLSSLSEFDKTTVGPAVLKALKPLVTNLRLDIARRTENIDSDADMKPSLRAAKVIGAWLGSIVRWKEDYEGSLNRIEMLSLKKQALEQQCTTTLGKIQIN
jgi:hypothetical protein